MTGERGTFLPNETVLLNERKKIGSLVSVPERRTLRDGHPKEKRGILLPMAGVLRIQFRVKFPAILWSVIDGESWGDGPVSPQNQTDEEG